VLLGPDGVRVDQGLGEYVPEWLGPDVLLAAAVFLSAGTGTRVMKAQMMTAAADRLGLWRRLERRIPLLSELTLGGNDPQSAGVVLLHSAARHRTQNEDEPPVAADDARDAMHVRILAQFPGRRQSVRKLVSGALRAGLHQHHL
jgi:hypothetical protein